MNVPRKTPTAAIKSHGEPCISRMIPQLMKKANSRNTKAVKTQGIVTAVDSNGFYLQDATGDGNSATSDAIFVFTSAAPTVAVGDAVIVSGTLTEFAADATNLTLTEINAPTITLQSHNNALPNAVIIGTGYSLPPTTILDDDGLTSYDPAHDGLDYYESLEGMRVVIQAPIAVSNRQNCCMAK